MVLGVRVQRTLDVSLLKLDVSGSLNTERFQGALPPSLKHNISFSLPLFMKCDFGVQVVPSSFLCSES